MRQLLGGSLIEEYAMYPTLRAARFARLGLAVGLLLVSSTLTILAVAPPAAADVSDPYVPYPPAGRWVPSAGAAFDHLSRKADLLGIQRTGIAQEPTSFMHYQGIARVDAADGTPYFIISKGGVGIVDDEPGYLTVARMGSRGRDGERLRTNLNSEDKVANLAQDQIVKSIRLNGIGGWPRYQHPGGMQLVGHILAIGADTPLDAGDAEATIMFVDVEDPANPRYLGRFSPPDIGQFGFGTDPVGMTAVRTADGKCCTYVVVAAGGEANQEVRFFRSKPNLPDGSTDLGAGPHWEETLRIHADSLTACMGTNFPTGDWIPGGQHQMLNFVREGGLDGRLYLIGARRDGLVVNPWAAEIMEMYEVNLTAGGVPTSCPLTLREATTFSEAAWGRGPTDLTFSAGSSVYISPTGEMLVYVTTHHGDPVMTVGEFRLWRVARDNSPTFRPTANVGGPFVVDEGASVQLTGHGSAARTKAFVQLFEEGGTGSSIDEAMMIVDYADRDSAHFENLATVQVGACDGFYATIRCALSLVDNEGTLWERTSSVRWFAPPGCTISLSGYPRNSVDWPGPGSVMLHGTGSVEEIDNLGATPTYEIEDEKWPASPVPAGVTPIVRDLDDTIEGVTFYHQVPSGDDLVERHDCEAYYNATVGLGWDLDNNGSYDATGASATFSAGALDGPTIANVRVRAQHPTDTSVTGTGEPIGVPVTVRNVAPQVVSAALSDSLGRDLAGPDGLAVAGLPVSLGLRFTDPGVADTQTARVVWGDGSSSSTFSTFHDARGGVTGELAQSHTFPGPGTYDVATTITDDDQGATTVHRSVVVVSAASLISNVANQLTTLIGQSTRTTVIAALRNARDELIGNHAGQPPTNGAVDKIGAGDPSSAITKLKAAIAFLQTAEAAGAGDLGQLKDRLGLAAQAIATQAYAQARSRYPLPTAKQAAALQAVGDLVTRGHQKLMLHQYALACDSFRQATDKAAALRR